MFFERLPVDLIAEILGELDLESLIQMAYVSKRFYSVASDPSLNPWRRPIMRILNMHMYEPALKHLSVRLIVPRRNWIEIITLARPSFVLYDATLPNLKSEEWEECFKRRFLPSWQKWKKESSWKEAFLKCLGLAVLMEILGYCTEFGIAVSVLVQATKHGPKYYRQQNNLSHLETRIRASYRVSSINHKC
ncbi:hypothetical protein JR316_0004644 [Psilocybe cubensis]|uniref:Uncharacterized protein n=1 Tax=Psilocybe cubensis TaxID=181762 RepID=A0ACB8H3Y0_PSICU|nr:hypothetical protein JR316_0004644 [Psilocybe cubensis]KAH9482544.1 hypothetical protein JR316_0004644 [Psilocybe cubensis]